MQSVLLTVKINSLFFLQRRLLACSSEALFFFLHFEANLTRPPSVHMYVKVFARESCQSSVSATVDRETDVVCVCRPAHLQAVTQKQCDHRGEMQLRSEAGAVETQRGGEQTVEGEGGVHFLCLTHGSFVCLTVYTTGQVSVAETYECFCVFE